jgi:8-oxo-dGTP pyrophosphatase MutT (NUDIX family)
MSNWQRLSTKVVYQNPYIKVHEDNVITPDGKPAIYGWVETPPGVFVVALEDDGKVVLVKQVRYTTGQPTWELPGGNSDGEDIISGGKKELEEEAGLHADKWVQLGGEMFVWSGVATERDVVVIAKGLHKAKKSKLANDDVIDRVHSFTWAELKDMISSGELNDGQTISALLKAGLHLGTIK